MLLTTDELLIISHVCSIIYYNIINLFLIYKISSDIILPDIVPVNSTVINQIFYL